MIQSLADLERDLPPKDDYSPAPDHIEKAVGEALFSLIGSKYGTAENPFRSNWQIPSFQTTRPLNSSQIQIVNTLTTVSHLSKIKKNKII
jgi:hypothetical protein